MSLSSQKGQQKNATDDIRKQQIIQWIESELGYNDYVLEPASADASFRRYFRLTDKVNGDSKIIMDAPPEKEDSHPFVQIAQSLDTVGLNVPKVYAQNFKQGFFLLSDLGCVDYLRDINDDNASTLYADAMQALITIQCKHKVVLPVYNDILLQQEIGLFTEWFIARHKKIILSSEQQKMLDDVFTLLVDSALSQPQVCVHRDYHSRNLMVTEQGNPGILDFQDAVQGPISYDLVSMLRDCYVMWPTDKVAQWTLQYFELAKKNNLLPNVEFAQFERWFDLMGIQRHLKAIGIFSRLNYRDGKSAYLNDIPRTLSYITMVSDKYPELKAFNRFANTLF